MTPTHIGHVYIGIDPGSGGGIAMLRDDGSILSAVAMPDTESDILEALKAWNTYGLNARAVLERVWSSPGWGHVGAFRFGLNYGACRMALMAAQIPSEEVLPQKWQAAMNCRSGKDKNVTKRRAQGLWPRYVITHAIADALLLAEYARRVDRAIAVAGASEKTGAIARRNEGECRDARQNERRAAGSAHAGGGRREDGRGASWKKAAGLDAETAAGRMGEAAGAVAGDGLGTVRTNEAALRGSGYETAGRSSNGNKGAEQDKGGRQGQAEGKGAAGRQGGQGGGARAAVANVADNGTGPKRAAR